MNPSRRTLSTSGSRPGNPLVVQKQKPAGQCPAGQTADKPVDFFGGFFCFWIVTFVDLLVRSRMGDKMRLISSSPGRFMCFR